MIEWGGCTIKLIVAGGRDFNDYNVLTTELNDLLSNLEESSIEIVCGMARGADSLGERYAKENHIPIKYFPANWNAHGKSAGYIRNEEMARYSTHLIAFWDGKSKGTKHMIDLARKYNLIVEVVSY